MSRKRMGRLNTLTQAMSNIINLRTGGVVQSVEWGECDTNGLYFNLLIQKRDGIKVSSLTIYFECQDIEYVTGAISCYVMCESFMEKVCLLYVDGSLDLLSVTI